MNIANVLSFSLLDDGIVGSGEVVVPWSGEDMIFGTPIILLFHSYLESDDG
eukprot:CAMPEP_0170795864 /NCGR_PEP_ID=MMETSP0733-20121128/24433_1 /TAXON_ID=186038 /ORGANISM="Fragilariopsis kerguelensis, Strain L26-C5" /LENGTH=50 /DNA_ID=CAMNT_0011145945 /DNA_START=382 /DNA_END=534 /DNA_ORIENTATION=-